MAKHTYNIETDEIRNWLELTARLAITLLDILDTDAEDLEDDEREPDVDDEPSLSATSDVNQEHAWKHSYYRWETDLEDEHDGREPQCEDEGCEEGV